MAKKKTNRKNTNNYEAFRSTCGGIVSSVLSFFIFILFLVFSLRYDRYYFNILEAKTEFFQLCAAGMLIISLIFALIFLFIDFAEHQGANTRQMFKKLLPANWRSTFSIPDTAILLYAVFNIISTLQSDYPRDAFLGSYGRFTGLLLNLLYVAVYFLISRFWQVKEYLFEVFLFSGLLVCLLGITDYFQLDLLNFRVNIKAEQATIFMSTIGNINTYTAYVALVMGFSSAMFLTEQQKFKRLWYFVCMVISFFAIIMGVSENAYLAIGALFAFTPLYLFRKSEGVIRYIVMLASFFTVILCTHYLNLAFPEQAIGLEGLFHIIARGKSLIVLVILLWLIAGGLKFSKADFDSLPLFKKNIPSIAWSALLLCGAAVLIFSLIDVNVLGHSERYGALNGYLLFNDQWGTNRGYIWRKTMEVFHEFSPIRKLFGYGPDTFAFITDTFYTEMKLATGQEFDSAHNEYLQFLVTIGITGLASYMVFLVSLVGKLIKAAKANPYGRAILMAVICYLFQATVNINLPVVTPMLWLLMSCGMAMYRGQQRAAETAR